LKAARSFCVPGSETRSSHLPVAAGSRSNNRGDGIGEIADVVPGNAGNTERLAIEPGSRLLWGPTFER
jgi:hypothetical protein